MFGIKGILKTVKGSIISPHISHMGFVLTFVTQEGELVSDYSKKFAKTWPSVRNAPKSHYVSKLMQIKPGDISGSMLLTNMYSYNCFVLNNGVVNKEYVKISFDELSKLALSEKATIHIQKDESFDSIKPLLIECFINKGIGVTCYEDN